MLNKYTLFIPHKVKCEIKTVTHKSISLDPGLRTFMTGISEKNAVNIGTNTNYKIGKYITKWNNINNNENILKSLKKKHEIRINKKISNKIDDLHWKSIKYLTSNYDSIFLGDMSSQEIVRKENSFLSPVQKVSCLRTKYFVFQQRLEYKSKQKGINYKLIDESYTSKACSQCGEMKDDLGSNKTYNCNVCLLNLDRDLNGARNIYFKSC